MCSQVSGEVWASSSAETAWRWFRRYLRVVQGRWKYLYRAIDRDGALVDVMLSDHRDLAAAKAFFRSAKAVTGVTPDRVTTDGHDAYPRAIRAELSWASACGTEPAAISTTVSSRTTAASRADVDPCSGS
jgi:transposase-like protein